MNIYLIKDYFRINGLTGEPVEKEYARDFLMFEKSLMLECGRNQYVSFQVIFDTHGVSVEKLTVDFSDLSGAGLICREQYEVFIEWFHNINGSYVPDMLIPLGSPALEFRVPLHDKYLKDQKAGALWVDLFIPGDTLPGNYSGKVDIRVNDAVKKEFKISINVHKAVVPQKSRITADLNNYADSISHAFPRLWNNENRYNDGSFFDTEMEFVRLSRDHRCLFHNLGYKHSGKVVPSFAPELEGEGKGIRVKSWELFDRHFGPYLDGSAFKGSKCGEHPIEFLYLPFNLAWPASYEKWGQKGYRTECRRIIGEFVKHFEEEGWKDTYFEIFLNHKKDYRFFPYTVDEIWYEHDEEAVDLYYDVIRDAYASAGVKFVFRMDSSNHYGNHFNSKYSDMCDMWIVGSDMFSWFPESIPVMREKGNIVWIYGGVLCSLKESFLSLFSWPVRCFMTGATGFTIWDSTGFGDDCLSAPLDGGTRAIMYPGIGLGIDSPLPSIRLKALRNYMQLADLMMTTGGMDDEGPLARRQVERIINRHYGFENNNCWWAEKPEFINEPPRVWDFEKKVTEAALKPLHTGRSPLMIEKIGRDILQLMDELW